MGKHSFFVAVVSIVAGAVILVGCQQAPPVQSGQAEEMLDTWMNQGNKIIEAALEFPPDKYDYRPSKDVRTFGETIRHLAAVNFRYVRGEQGRPYDSEQFKAENFEGKDDLVRLLQASYQEGAELVEPFTDAEMLEAVKNPYEDYTTSRYAYWMQAVEHAAEHYGNLVVYYRLNGIVPPASRPKDQ
jgi:uncharacterized damage-inducible protein DinB